MKDNDGNDMKCSVCGETHGVAWFLGTSVLVCGKSQCYSELLEDWRAMDE